MLSRHKKLVNVIVDAIVILCIVVLAHASFTLDWYETAAGGNATYLLNWTTENTRVDAAASGNWTDTCEAGECDYNSTIPLSGSYSAQIKQDADAGSEYYESPNISYSGTLDVYTIFRQATSQDLYASRVVWLVNSGASDVCYVDFFPGAPGKIRLYHGTVYSEVFSVFSVDTTYYIWLDYTAGTGADGAANVYIATSSTKPGSPTASVSTGDATTDAQNVRLGAAYNTGGGYHLYDNILADDATIGSQ